MTSFIAARGSGRSTSVIPAVPAAWSVTTIAFIAHHPGIECVTARHPALPTRAYGIPRTPGFFRLIDVYVYTVRRASRRACQSPRVAPPGTAGRTPRPPLRTGRAVERPLSLSLDAAFLRHDAGKVSCRSRPDPSAAFETGRQSSGPQGLRTHGRRPEGIPRARLRTHRGGSCGL